MVLESYATAAIYRSTLIWTETKNAPTMCVCVCVCDVAGMTWNCSRRSNRRWRRRMTSARWRLPASRPRCLERTAVSRPTSPEQPTAVPSSRLSVSRSIHNNNLRLFRLTSNRAITEQHLPRRAALCTEGLSRLNCCHTRRTAIWSTAPALLS